MLDLGCGTGRWFHVILKADFILGVDFSDEMLNKAKEMIYGERHTNNINLVRSDIFNLPLKKDIFDCVFSIGVLAEHTPLNDEVFEEVGRILKRGGLFLFTAQKIGIIPKLRVKVAQLLFPLLSSSVKERIELFRTGFDHNEQTIRRLAKRHDFDVQEVEVKSLTKSDFYFVYAQRGV